ncbi:MAG: nitroreductase family protein [Nocardioidaceae bacterium]
MEFQQVVDKRRMVRNFTPEAVDPGIIDRVLANASRAPSAGFSQGWAFLLLDTPEDVSRFWACTTDDGEGADSWSLGMQRAPVIVVPLSCKRAYLERYAESDKGWTDLDESRWPVPYWDIDTGMAALLMLQTVVDEGLGACFFGIPPECTAAFRAEYGVPAEFAPIGAVAIGHRAASELVGGSSATRPRRSLAELVHRSSW